ncbi:MAG TPA: hypothetical protein VFH63_04785 [candidate division Zixibacteria bacterium]|nr:hypothetical protein [candidate division Zixibacteria bacterium]
MSDRFPRGRCTATGALSLLLVMVLGACQAVVSPTPTASPQPTPVPTATPTPRPAVTGSPSPTPEPLLSLAPPAESDARRIAVTVTPAVPADGSGRIDVTVTSLADERVAELVLRWPTELSETLFLAPFEPTPERLAEGRPLVQPWSKWVVGPGERGEPAGTISLGWGPLDPGATLQIPVVVTRRAPGPVEFDLQFLAGEALLTLESGEPAELRVAVP